VTRITVIGQLTQPAQFHHPVIHERNALLKCKENRNPKIRTIYLLSPPSLYDQKYMPPATGNEDAISAIDRLTIHAMNPKIIQLAKAAFGPAIITAQPKRAARPETKLIVYMVSISGSQFIECSEVE
jgi:hypothetical protein